MTTLRNRMTSRNRKWENAPVWTSKAVRLRAERLERAEARRVEALRAETLQSEALDRAVVARLTGLLVKRLPDLAETLREYPATCTLEHARWFLTVLTSTTCIYLGFYQDGLTWEQIQSWRETKQTDSAFVRRVMGRQARMARLIDRLVVRGVQARGEV